jgi:RpiB/LacA/LacB family sugar-phosphate isomerase
MRVVLGSDHAGFEMKQKLIAWLRTNGFEVLDVGTDSTRPVDYPDFAEAVGMALRDGLADRGVLLCGSGVGASVAANKIPGIYAGLCHDVYSAQQGVEHESMNVLVMGARVIGLELAFVLVRSFLNAGFSGEQRHRRRLEKVVALEARWAGAGTPAARQT